MTMMESSNGRLLRIYLNESDKYGGRPLYQWLLRKAREEGLAGGTVLRGLAGYGASSRLHTVKVMRLAADLPVVVEFVDSVEKIDAFLPVVDEAVGEGLVTLEKVTVRQYRDEDSET